MAASSSAPTLHAPEAPLSQMGEELSDEQLRRYARHIMLDEIGQEGQERICAARALIVGLGGLGCPAALYLVSSGIGALTLVDHDQVDLTNLQRQVLFDEPSINQPKPQAAAERLQRLRTDVRLRALPQRADAALLDELVPQHDIVLDCSDNFATRHAINRACVRHAKPLVSGSALRMDGQLFISDQRLPAQACYACLFPEEDGFEETRCALLGVFAPLVGIIGALQASATLRLLAQPAPAPVNQPQELLLWDARSTSLSRLQVAPRSDCKVCATGAH